MPEWLIERGIGETRAALVERGRIVEARIFRDGIVPAGTVLKAKLTNAGCPAVAVAEDQEYLLPTGAPGIAQGAQFTIEVTREYLGGPEPWKRALARASEESERAASLPEGRELSLSAAVDELEESDWSDLIEEARSGLIGFPDGELRIFPTPAMTLIDVDGTLEPAKLAVAGARAAATAIRRHGIGGSIGIDLPTVAGRAERQRAAEAIDELLPLPFERTAVNGFGFVQIIRPRRHASTFDLAADRPAFEARALLRLASRQLGAMKLVANPAVIAKLEVEKGWIDRLSRQVGGPVTLRSDAALAMSAGHVQRS